MDKQTKATLTQSAQHMAEGLKIMNPPEALRAGVFCPECQMWIMGDNISS